MCFSMSTPTPPPPPPLAPPPPPEAPPAPPLPDAVPVETEINPRVRAAKSKKAKNPNTKGTGALRIPLNPSVNTGTSGPAGGVNT